MFTTLFRETDRPEDVLDAWESAAHDSRVAWDAWLASDVSDRGAAYAGYRASLDREERAAEALAASMASRQRRAPLFSQ